MEEIYESLEIAEEFKEKLKLMKDYAKQDTAFKETKISIECAIDDMEDIIEQLQEVITKHEQEEEDYMNREYERSVL